MCGLVGVYSSNMLQRHKDVLSTMLYLDTLRGKDATGVAALRHNADTEVMKSTVPGHEFVEGPALDRFLRLNDFCWIGHNRYGTVGKNVKTNAHPFTVDDADGACLIVGAHNGTLRNKHVLDDHLKFGTDSEAMLNSIAFEGVEPTMAKLEGAWAVVYYDHLEEELRVFRNKERTLYYAYEEDKKTLFWASEIWMIRIACMRSNVKLKDDNVFAFTEDTLHCFPVPLKLNEEITCQRKGGLVGKEETKGFFLGSKTGGTSSQNTTPHSQAAKSSEKGPINLNQQPMTGNYGKQGTTVTADPVQPSSPASETLLASNLRSGTTISKTGEKLHLPNAGQSKTPSNSNVVPFKTYKGFGGEILTKSELDDHLENGCAWCEEEFISPNDRYAWLDRMKPICSKCLDGDEDVIVVPRDKSKLN
jgi:hypothetical protein